MIENPIIRGFHPDPSICRVGNDYYLAVSTFEWFPGVRIYHSTNLEKWTLVSRPLNRVNQLDLKGNDDSGGVFAPALSYSDGLFYLVYTDVKGVNADVWKDGNNYLVTCETIDGVWSDPIFLNASGFDPSLFHGPDGRKHLVNMVWDHREGNHRFYGIALQEYSPEEARLVGKPTRIFEGTKLGLTEGPHIYIRNHYYYLVTAEGGTSYAHAVTVARSRALSGPYEVHPVNPILTSWHAPFALLQKAGHASFVESPDKEWYMVHLASRPLQRKRKAVTEERGYCPLGRETAIQQIFWEDDWPYVVDGPVPSRWVKRPANTLAPASNDFPVRKDYHFTAAGLDPDFQTLRIPFDQEIGSLTERPGFLRLYGRESLHSKFIQSHVARRWQSIYFEAETKVYFQPTYYQQEAGIVCYYNTKNWASCHITWDEIVGTIIHLTFSDQYQVTMPIKTSKIAIDPETGVRLKVVSDGESLTFSYATEESWVAMPVTYPIYKLSDDYGNKADLSNAAFTGAFVGMYCVDSMGTKKAADFEGFCYREYDIEER